MCELLYYFSLYPHSFEGGFGIINLVIPLDYIISWRDIFPIANTIRKIKVCEPTILRIITTKMFSFHCYCSLIICSSARIFRSGTRAHWGTTALPNAFKRANRMGSPSSIGQAHCRGVRKTRPLFPALSSPNPSHQEDLIACALLLESVRKVFVLEILMLLA